MADQLEDTLIKIGEAHKTFVAKVDQRLAAFDTYQEEIERKLNMTIVGGISRDQMGEAAHDVFLRQVKSRYPTDRGNVSMSVDEYVQYKLAFNKYIRHGDRMLNSDETKAMQVGVDPDGGYLAPSEYSQRVIQVEQLNSVMRGLVTAVPTGAGSLEIPAALSMPAAAWVGETQSRTATGTPGVGTLEIFAREIYAQPEVTQKLLDDSAFNIETFLGNLVGDQFAIAEDAAFISGDSVLKPHGFLNYLTSSVSDLAGGRPFGTIQYVASGQAGAWPSTDPAIYDFLTNIVMSLKPAYRRNATWVMPTTAIARLMQIKDAQNRPIWVQSMVLGQPSLLLGYPVVEAEQMPVVAANSYSIAFADWKRAYWITDRFGVRVLRDPYTNKPFVRYYTTKRMGGGVVDSLAIKLGKFAAS